MVDRENVAKGLECCYKYETNIASGLVCEECPYNKNNYLGTCTAVLLRDTIELLKEQEPAPPRKVKRYIEYSDTGVNVPDTYDCGNCGEELPDNAKYCPVCGRPVKWE